MAGAILAALVGGALIIAVGAGSVAAALTPTGWVGRTVVGVTVAAGVYAALAWISNQREQRERER